MAFSLDIPNIASSLNINTWNLGLYSRTDDFQKSSLIQPVESPLEIGLNLDLDKDGVCVERNGDIFNVQGRPRALITKDGRIYVCKHQQSQSQYVETLEHFLPQLQRAFTDPRATEFYNRELMKK